MYNERASIFPVSTHSHICIKYEFISMVTGESVCGFLLNSHSTIFRICGQNKKKRSYPGFLHLQIHTYQLTQNSGTSDLCAIPECSHLLLVVHGHDILYGVASWVSGGCADLGMPVQYHYVPSTLQWIRMVTGIGSTAVQTTTRKMKKTVKPRTTTPSMWG